MGARLARNLGIVMARDTGGNRRITMVEGGGFEGNSRMASIAVVAGGKMRRRLRRCGRWAADDMAVCTVAAEGGVVWLAVGYPACRVVAG